MRSNLQVVDIRKEVEGGQRTDDLINDLSTRFGEGDIQRIVDAGIDGAPAERERVAGLECVVLCLGEAVECSGDAVLVAVGVCVCFGGHG